MHAVRDAQVLRVVPSVVRARRRVRVGTTRARRSTGDVLQDAQRRSVGRGTTRRRGETRTHAADAARAGSNPDVDDKGKNKGEGARARSTPPEDGPGDDKERGNAGVSDRQRRVADRVAAAARLWDGFAPFLRSTRDRTRLGKASRKMLASSSLDENERARLASLDDEAGAAEFARIVASRDAEVDDALARVATAAAGAPVAAPSPWPALRRGQRETVRWLAARHLAGLGGVVANGVGAGKRLATLAHLLHLRDGLVLRGPHLLACPRENAATWIADLNRWCPKLRAVSLASPEDERTSAKAAALRAGGIDVVIVPTDALIESSAALVAKEKAEKEMKAEKEAKEVKAEEEEKDAAAVNTRTDPDAGASDPTAVPSKRRKKSGKTRKSSSDRRSRVKEDASDGVLPAAALRASFRCLIVDADGDAAATLPALAAASPARRVVYSRVIVVGGARLRATVDADAARTFAPRSRWFSPNRSPPRTPSTASTRARAAQRRTTPTPRRSPRRRRRPTRFSVLFYASTTTPRTTPRTTPIAPRRTRRSFAFASQSERRRRVTRRRASRRCRRRSRDFARRAVECSSSRRRSRRSTRRPRRSETRASRTFDSTSRLAARGFTPPRGFAPTRRRLRRRVGFARWRARRTPSRISRKMW